MMQFFLPYMSEVSMLLAWYAFSDEVMAISLHSRGNVSSSQNSCRYNAISEMIAINSLVLLALRIQLVL